MKRHHRKWILVVLAIAVAAAFFLHRTRQVARPPGDFSCGGHCGVERWSVKTLSDSDREKVDFTPQATTVAWLVSQQPPSVLPADARIPPIETQVFAVRARLVGFKEEQDRDFHVVLADLENPALTMIVEIPSAGCSGACASGYADEFEKARAALVAQFGNPASRFQRVSGDVTVSVTGVGFFDFLHGQTGVAPNGIELHPVLSLRVE